MRRWWEARQAEHCVGEGQVEGSCGCGCGVVLARGKGSGGGGHGGNTSYALPPSWLHYTDNTGAENNTTQRKNKPKQSRAMPHKE